MSAFVVQLPILFLKFYFWEVPQGLFSFFLSLNKAFIQIFSLGLFLKTFFKPLKNEYRKGLVGFSIGMGIVVKTVIILVDILLFSLLLLCELFLLIGIPLLPILSIGLLFL